MKERKYWISIILLVFISIIITSCNNDKDLSVEQILDKSTKMSEELESYHMTTLLKIKTEDGELEKEIREWTDGNRFKMETDTNMNDKIIKDKLSFDGKEYILYLESEDMAFSSKSLDNIYKIYANIEELYMDRSKSIFTALKDGYEIGKLEDEKIEDYDSYQLELDNKEIDDLDERIWIDKDIYIIRKQFTKSNDQSMETLVLDFEEKEFDDSIFKLDIPDEIKIVDFDKILEESDGPQEDKSKKADEYDIDSLPENSLYLPEKSGYKFVEAIGEKDIVLIQKYNKENNDIFLEKNYKEQASLQDIDWTDEIDIRDGKGYIEEKDGLRSIWFEEDGYIYSLTDYESRLEIDDIKELIEMLVLN